MALGTWSGRRIAFLWILGIAFYGALTIIGQAQRRNVESSFRAKYGLPTRNHLSSADTLSEAQRDSSFGLLFALWRETSRGTPAHRDSILHQLSAIARDTPVVRERRDSLYRALKVPAHLNPSQQDSLRVAGESLLGAILVPAARAIGSAMSDLGPWLFIMVALYLAPGVVLLVMTIAWVFLRRRNAIPSGVPAA